MNTNLDKNINELLNAQKSTEIELREEGLNNLKANSNKLKIEDSNRIKNIDDMEDFIEKALAYIKSIDEGMNLVIAIDSINDIRLSPKYGNLDKNAKSEEVAKAVKEWTVKYNVPIFTSVHLRKLNGNRRPTLDDLKESNTLVYEASVIWLLHNDVSKNKQGAKVYYTDTEDSEIVEKKPIIEFDWAKNKKSSYKGRSFCYFSPEFSKAVECGEDASRRFNALVYEG